MKYLKKFFNVNYYNQFINRANFEGPNVSLLTDNHEVKYITRPSEYEELTIPGYTVLEYISSTQTGGQYIDLGCKLLENTDDIQIDIKFNHHGQGKVMNNSNGDKQWTLIGNQVESSPYPGFVLRHKANSSKNYVEFMSKWEISDSHIDSNNYYSDYLPGTAFIKNSIHYSETFVNNIYKCSFTLDNIPAAQCHQMNTHLFCTVNGNGDPWRFAYADLYYLKITKGNIIIRDLIPVQRNSDDAVGLYDLENNVFYQSQGSESFVPHYKVKIYNNIYKKVEHIQTTTQGAQYFDLNYPLFENINNDNIRIDIKFNCLSSGYDDNYNTKRATILSCENSSLPYQGFVLRKIENMTENNINYNYYITLDSHYEYNDFILDDLNNINSTRTGMYVSKYMNGYTQSNLYGETKVNELYEKSFIFNNIPSSQAHTNSLVLFVYKNNTNNVHNYYAKIKLYYLKVIKNNNIIFDLIPVERLTDHKLGLYDKEHNVFYEPQYGRADLHESLIQGEYIN